MKIIFISKLFYIKFDNKINEFKKNYLTKIQSYHNKNI